MSVSSLQDLIEKGRLLQGDKILYLFSKSGFTKDLQDLAAQDAKVNLVSFEQMLEAFS
jgi:hypothetical protein